MAKKKSLEEDVSRGLDELQRSGLSLDDFSAALVPRLEERFGKGRETDLAIIYALGKIADPGAMEALVRVEKQSLGKDIKKAIRRSMFRLTQRGIAVPKEESEGASRPTSSLFRGAPEIEAYMSPVDGGGGRLVWIVKPQAGHGLQAIQAMVNDREGLHRFGGAQVRRKELRNMTRQIKEQHGVTMVAVPWEYADQMLYEGFEKAKSLGRSGFENFHELRSVVNSGKPKEQKHPVYGRLEAETVREGAWRELSRRLLDEPEFRFWILDSDWIQPFIAPLQEAQTSRLVLNPLQKEERISAIVRDAVKSICAGETGAILQRRLEDMALYFVETARTDLAKLALAVALQVQEGDPGPLDISFLTGLAQKSFALHLSQEKSKAEEEPSFIVKP